MRIAPVLNLVQIKTFHSQRSALSDLIIFLKYAWIGSSGSISCRLPSSLSQVQRTSGNYQYLDVIWKCISLETWRTTGRCFVRTHKKMHAFACSFSVSNNENLKFLHFPSSQTTAPIRHAQLGLHNRWHTFPVQRPSTKGTLCYPVREKNQKNTCHI